MNKLLLNIYLKRNNRACMVFKRNGILYRINNLMQADDFILIMRRLSTATERAVMEDFYLELYDHRGKCWVLECTLLNGVVALNIWFQSKSSGEHLDIRFKWQGIAVEFRTAVRDMCVMAGVSRVLGMYRS